jgi:hypothetical protein
MAMQQAREKVCSLMGNHGQPERRWISLKRLVTGWQGAEDQG